MSAYYNEWDPYAAQWLRNLIAAGHIAPGEVDTRSIIDVSADDLKGFTQCHFFAGIGGWSLAARLAGFPDDRAIWSASCPCQPFSVAGEGKAQDDKRHLWPVVFGLIRARTPALVVGEQVAAAIGKDWLDGVFTDLESIGYACGATVVPACAVGAPHRRDRLWFVADANQSRAREGREQSSGQLGGACSDQRARACHVGDSDSVGPQSGNDDPAAGHRHSAAADGRQSRGIGARNVGDAGGAGLALGSRPDEQRGALRNQGATAAAPGDRSPWRGAAWAPGADGKARRVEPGIRLLAHGVPARVGKLRAYGNAIVPQVAAQIIGAYLDAE